MDITKRIRGEREREREREREILSPEATPVNTLHAN
jgi:hypothetical protein